MKLSASIILKNESKEMERMLQSLAGFDEIVIVDTGSVDNTVEIAHKYTNKVFTYEWKDDFADARNYALSKCEGDWVLSIDGDEWLEVPVEMVREAAEKADSLGLKTVDCQLFGEGNDNMHAMPRLFKRLPGIHFVGAIHEILNISDGNLSDIKMRYGTSSAHQLDPERNMRILKKEVEKNPTDGRNMYYLAREYWYLQDYTTALHHFELAMPLEVGYSQQAETHLMAAYCAWHTSQGDLARHYCLQAIGFLPSFKEAYMLMSEMYYEPRKSVWKKLADQATNEGVLFVRT